MNTAVINIKIEPIIKRKAQRIAEELGFSLSSLINAYLRQLIRTKAVIFTAKEKPTNYLLQALKSSREDIKKGRVVSFEKADEALRYLDNLIANEQKSQKN